MKNLINAATTWLMERGYSERMVRTQILKARGVSRNSLLERENTKTSESKLTFNITYYPEFQNVRSILEELLILQAPDKEHKKVFSKFPIVGFRNGKSLKGYLVRAAQRYQRWTMLEALNHVGRVLVKCVTI